MTLTYGQMRNRATKIADANIKARVKRGLKLLQDEHGAGWVEKIDCETLLLDDVNSCVLGQVYGHYLNGLDELDIKSSGLDYGFNAANTDEMESLQQAWETVLCK